VKSVRTARRSASDHGLRRGYSVWTEVKLLNAAAASIWSFLRVLKTRCSIFPVFLRAQGCSILPSTPMKSFVYNTLALLSRQRSRVRVPSSPPDSKRLRSDLAEEFRHWKGTVNKALLWLPQVKKRLPKSGAFLCVRNAGFEGLTVPILNGRWNGDHPVVLVWIGLRGRYGVTKQAALCGQVPGVGGKSSVP